MALNWEDDIGCWVVRTTEVRCAALLVTIDKERCIEDEPHDVSDGSVLHSGSPVRSMGNFSCGLTVLPYTSFHHERGASLKGMKAGVCLSKDAHVSQRSLPDIWRIVRKTLTLPRKHTYS
jgi:hypothetical protein